MDLSPLSSMMILEPGFKRLVLTRNSSRITYLETCFQEGREFGVTTGRPRRCGWLDIPLLKYILENVNYSNIQILSKNM